MKWEGNHEWVCRLRFGRRKSWTISGYYPDICLKRVRETRGTSIRIATSPAKIRTGYLLNSVLELLLLHHPTESIGAE
jgi:hypothetical protein